MGQHTNYRRLCTVFVLALLLLPITAHAKTINVFPNTSVPNLKSAIAIAANNDTILIKQATYFENEITIDKSVYIMGINNPVIDGNSKSWIIKITSPNVTVTGLTIKGSAVSYVNDNAGLLLDEVHGCHIFNNVFIDNFFAIYMAKSYDCVIDNNRIESNASTEAASGNGIHLWYCRDISINGNKINGHRDGLYFEFVKHSRIVDNESYDNLRYGLHFMFSDSCEYSDNRFYENGAGVAVMYTRYVKMHNNEIKQNWGPSSYGLLLKEIVDSEITNNTFYRNSIGLYSEACTRVTVKQNDFVENGWAVKIMANSIDNKFTKNNFIGNSFQVATNSRQNFSSFVNNYWSDYRGYDLDKDGYGDVPFRPVTLFSIVVEKEPATLVLLRSLLVEILDLAENLIPSITPETLVDNVPSMRPIQ